MSLNQKLSDDINAIIEQCSNDEINYILSDCVMILELDIISNPYNFIDLLSNAYDIAYENDLEDIKEQIRKAIENYSNNF